MNTLRVPKYLSTKACFTMPAAIENLCGERPPGWVLPNPDVPEKAYRGTLQRYVSTCFPSRSIPISFAIPFAATDMVDERQKYVRPTLVPAIDPSSPPTYESVVYAYDGGGELNVTLPSTITYQSHARTIMVRT